MVLQRKMVGKDQQDPASPFCTKQMKDITVRCDRPYSNLHTQVSHANVTSIAKSPMSPKIFTWQKTWNVARCISPCSIGCKQHYLQTEKTWQHSTAEATAHSLLAKIFFSRQQMVLHAYSKICAVQAKNISSRNISCPQGISVKVMRTASLSSRLTSSRCLAAMRATCKESGLPKHGQNIEQLWQQRKWSTKNLSAWFARCPWAPASWASAWQSTCCQFAIIKQQKHSHSSLAQSHSF